MVEEKLSVKEFKMWLKGVEEMQPDDWAPTSAQWVKIRSKINQLADTEFEHSNNNYYTYDPQTVIRPVVQQSSPQTPPPVTMSSQSSALSGAGPAPHVSAQGVGTPPLVTSTAQSLVRTPDVDTSKAPYASSFA